jgi:hypothetical protein
VTRAAVLRDPAVASGIGQFVVSWPEAYVIGQRYLPTKQNPDIRVRDAGVQTEAEGARGVG